MQPRVLLVGAYERDNLGDLLFLLVTEGYLRGAEVVAAAPFAADMRALVDRRVPAYGPLLRRERFDAIWTAGGQVGAIDAARAFRMSAPPREYRRYLRGSERRRTAILRRAAGGAPPLSPYIPSPLEFPLNAGAIGVLNSVGLSGIRRVEDERRERLIALLRGQSFIAVRDRPSSRFLADLGIEHRLVPDAVHAIGALWPVERERRPDVAVVQISSAILRQLGIERVAARIAGSRSLKGIGLRLLPAGTATGHDSVADYERLAARLRPRDVELVDARRPLELAGEIARARVVIGTSLHVRIIAAAYGVPRVSLARWKPAQYARTWDPGMPYGVGIDDVDAAVAAALAGDARAEGLTQRAHEHLEELARTVLALARSQAPRDEALRADARRRRGDDAAASRRDAAARPAA